MADTQKLPLTERYAFELGKKQAIVEFGNMIAMNVTGKKVENINSNDLARMLSLKSVLEISKTLIQQNALDLLAITEEIKKVLEKNNEKKN
jgi:type III secretory pathway component EscU